MNWFKRIFGSGSEGRAPRGFDAVLFLFLAFFAGLFLLKTGLLRSAPVSFSAGGAQANWATATPGVTAVLPIAANYDIYDSKDASMAGGTDIKLASIGYTASQTSDTGTGDTCTSTSCVIAGGFSAGTKTGTVVTGAGTAASVKLSNSVNVNEYTIGVLANIAVTASAVSSNPSGGWVVTLGAGTNLSRIFKNDKFTDFAAKAWKILSAFDSADKIIVIDSEANGGTPAAGAGTVGRWYATLQAWETARQGDLIARNAIEKGIAYNDGVFTAALTIDGSTTDATHYMWLTAAPTERHKGIAGTGVKIALPATGTVIGLGDPYTILEGLDIDTANFTGNAAAVDSLAGATDCVVRNLLIHDASGFARGIRSVETGWNVYNNIIYGMTHATFGYGIGAASQSINVFNNTLYNNAKGVSGGAGTIARNNIAVGTNINFSGSYNASSSNNISTDLTAPGTGSLTSQTLAQVAFQSTTAGSENLHLEFNSVAKNAGTDLSATLTADLDGDARTTPWDIGADDVGATLVKVHSIGTTGRDFATLQAWEDARDGVLTTRKVFKIANQTGGAFSAAGTIIKGCTSGFTGDYIPERATPSASEAYMTLDTTGSFSVDETLMMNTDSCATPTGPRATLSAILTAAGTIERGEAYKDSTFTAGVIIDGSTTDATHYMWLTAEPGSRHDGTSGSGVTVTPVSGDVFTISDPYTIVEWFIGKGYGSGTTEKYGVTITSANAVVRNNIFDGGTTPHATATGIRIADDFGLIYNNVLINLTGSTGGRGIASTFNGADNNTYYNNTVYNTWKGFDFTDTLVDGLARNNISASSTTANFSGVFHASSSNNISSDLTAPGTGSLTNKAAADLKFVSTAAGIEDLHIMGGSVAQEIGADLSATFKTDLDGPSTGSGQARPMGNAWDIGADELTVASFYEKTGAFESPAIDVGSTNYVFDALSFNATVPTAANGAGALVPAGMSGLVGLWHLDGTTNATISTTAGAIVDSQTNVAANNGTFSNVNLSVAPTTTYAAGRLTTAINFDGVDDYVRVTDNAALKPATITVMAWVKRNGAQPQYSPVIIKPDVCPSVCSAYEINLNPVGADSSQVMTCVGKAGGQTCLTSAAGVVPDNTWTHLAMTYDLQNVRLYVNGAQAANSPVANTAAILHNTNPLDIGTNNGLRYYKGLLDEAAIFNRALSADEIKGLYQSSRLQAAASVCANGATDAGTCVTTPVWGDANDLFVGPDGTVNTYFTQPVGLWHLNTVTSNQTPDASGNNNIGTLGATTAVEASDPTLNTTTPKLGAGAMSFDGVDDKVSLATSLDISALPFTVTAWVNPTDYLNFRPILDKRDTYVSNDMRFTLELWATTGVVTLHQVSSTISFSYSPPTGAWTHLTVVADSGGTNLYVNGTLQQTLGVFTLGTDPAAAVKIGSTSGGDFFKGLLDEVAIYDRALSAGEAKALYNAGAGREGAVGSLAGAGLNNKRYVKYKMNLATPDVTATPQIDDVTFDYSGYSSLATLTSSKFDTGAANSFVKSIAWTETSVTAAKDVKLQLSAAATSAGIGTFCGPRDVTDGSCTATTYFTDPAGAENIDDLQIPGRWFQYKSFLTSDGTGTATLDNINVTYDTVSFQLTSTGGATVNAGTAYPVTIKALDTQATPAPVTGYNGSKTLVFTGAAAIGANAPKISDDNICGDADDMALGSAILTFASGVADPPGAETNYYLCAYKAEAVTLSATASSAAIPTTTSLNVTVNALAASQLSFSQQPASTGSVDAAFTTQPIVLLTDTYGNPKSGVTISLSDVLAADNVTTGAGTLTGTTSLATDAAGLATFTGIGYTGTDTIHILATVASPALSVAGTTNIALGTGVTSLFALNAPADMSAGGDRAAYTVTRKDQYNNLVTTGAQTVYLYTNSTGAGKAFYDAFSAGNVITSVSIGAGSSSANFWYYDTASGTTTITASDATPAADGLTGIDDATDALGVNPGVVNKFTLTAPADIAAGNEAVYTVTRLDQYNNLVTAGANTVYLSSNSTGNKKFSMTSGGAPVTSVPISNSSSVSLYYYDDKVGSWTVTASDAATPDGAVGILDATDVIAVTPGPTKQIVFTTTSQSVAAGVVSGAMTVQAQDAYGNKNTADVSTVSLKSTSATMKFDILSTGLFDGTITAVTLAAGEKSFYFKDTTSSATATISLSLAQANILQTSDTGTGDTPNAGGFNAGAKSGTAVTGTGAAASIILENAATDLSRSASDNFDRANNADLGSSWDVVPSEINLQIVANKATPTVLDSTDRSESNNSVIWPDDQYSQAKIYAAGGTSGGGDGPGVGARMSSSAKTYYRVVANKTATNNIEVSKHVAGVYTSLGFRTAAWIDGDVLRLEVSGTTLKAFLNGSQLGADIIDASISSGRPGLAYSSGVAMTSASMDDWSGGWVITINSMIRSSNGDIYLGGSSGKFWKYVPSTNTFTDLTSKIASFWGTNNVNVLEFDAANNAVYLGGYASKFAKCSITTCVNGASAADDLSGKITWGATRSVNGLIYDSVDNMVYLAGGESDTISKFAKCDVATCINGASAAADLSGKISGIFGTSPVSAMAFDTTNRVLYFGGGNNAGGQSYFAKCGITSCVNGAANADNLTLLVPNYLNNRRILSLVFDSANQAIYGGSAYSASSPATRFFKCSVVNNNPCNGAGGSATDLEGKISGFWGVNHVLNLALDTVNSVVYLGGASGNFAKCGVAGCVNGASNAANLRVPDKISFWGVNGINALVSDAANGAVYLAGAGGKFAKYSDPYSGTLESATLDLGSPQSLGTVTWNPAAQPAGTTVNVKVAAKNVDSGWTDADFTGLSASVSYPAGVTVEETLIKQDCTGYAAGTCYTSLSAWEAAKQGDLVAANKIAVAKIDGAWTVADTTAVYISGWTTDANHFVHIYTTPAARHTGKWDTTKYRISSNDYSGPIRIGANAKDIRIEGLQLESTNINSAEPGYGILTGDYGTLGPGSLYVINNIIKKTGANVGSGIDFLSDSANRKTVIVNNIIYGSFSRGIGESGTSRDNDEIIIYNNTLYGSGISFSVYGLNDTLRLKNNLVQSAGTNYYIESTVTTADYANNISQDATSFNGAAYQNKTVTFVNAAGLDFRLASTDIAAKNAGTDLSLDANLPFNTDIEGHLRGSAAAGLWDIGAHEQGAVGGTVLSNLGAKELAGNETGLVGLWHLNEGGSSGTTADASGNGNTASLNSGTTGANTTAAAMWETTNKKLGAGALEFDGTNDFISVAPSASINNLPAMTVAGWIKPRSLGGSGVSWIVTKAGWIYEIMGTNQIKFTAKTSGAYEWRGTVPNSLDMNEWQHVVITWDGSLSSGGIHIYKNGRELAYAFGQGGGPSRLDDSAFSLFIGRPEDANPYYFDGFLDEMAVFNRVLTASEIKAMYDGAAQRYLRYKVYLTTTDTSVTPQVDDISIGNSSTSAQTNPVTPAAASYFTVTSATATPVAGTSFNVTLTAKDSFGNTATAYSAAAKTFTLSGPANAPNATAPSYGTNAAIVAAFVNGVATIPITLYKAETVSLDVSDGTLNSAGNAAYDADLVVGPAVAAQLAFSVQPPATVTAGVNFTLQPIVQIQDQYGNLRPADTNAVTLSAVLASDGITAGGGTFSATTNPLSATAGVVTFAGVNYTKAESIKLKAVSGVLTAALSNAITVNPAAASATTSTITATSPVLVGLNSTVTVTAKDAFNNPVPSLAITFTATGTENTLPGATTNAGGVATMNFSSTMPEEKLVSSSITGAATAAVSVRGIKVTAPATGAVWAAGSLDKNITWVINQPDSTPPNSRHIKIEYSSNGTTGWVSVMDGAVSAVYTGSFKASPQLWDIPVNAAIASTYKIRVSDLDNTDVFDSGTFSVSGGITLGAPVGGEKWSRTTAHNITWTKNGAFNTKVEYTTDGTVWNAVTNGGLPDNGLVGTSLSWTPSTNLSAGTAALKIRVSDSATANPVSTDQSATNVTVSDLAIGTLAGAITGGRIGVGQTLTVPWTSTGVTNVKLEYYSNTNAAYAAIPGAGALSAALGTYNWVVTDDVGPNVSVRATAVNAAGANDPSIEGLVQSTSAAFTIYGALTVVSPNGGESSSSTAPLPITFTGSTSIDAIKFYYKTSAGGAWTQITSGLTYTYTGGSGSASWTPAVSFSTVWIKVEDSFDALVSDLSDNFFILTGVGLDAAVVGNSPYTVGAVAAVSGTAVVSGNVKLEYSTTGSAGTYATLGLGANNVTVAAGAFSYNWTVANSIGSNVYIKVTDLASTANAIVGPVVIRAGFTAVAVSAPANGTFYTVGETPVISWTTAGTVANVKLEYYIGTYAETSAPDIAASVLNANYTWTVPDYINTGVKVRVSDADAGHPAAFGESAAFTVKGKLTITTPAVLYAGDTADVNWTVRGDMGNVRICYKTSQDNGVTDPYQGTCLGDVVALTASDWATGLGAAAQNGSYSWLNIFDALLAEVVDPQTDLDHAVYMKVRIEDADDAANVFSESNGFLVKYRAITWRVVDPNGNPISGLNVTEGATTTPSKAAWAIATSTFNGNNTVRYYPDNSSIGAATYSTMFDRTEAGIVYSTSAGTWSADLDKMITLTMDTAATAAVIYQTAINAVYDATNDAINVSSWLTQKGILVNDAAGLTAISVNVYDAAGTLLNATDLGLGKTVNPQGIFSGIAYDPAAGIDPNITYTIKAAITYNGKQYVGVSGFVSPSVFAYTAQIGAIYNNANDSIMANIWLERSGTTVTDPGDMTFRVFSGASTTPLNGAGGQIFDGYDTTTDTIKDAALISGVYTGIEYNPAGVLDSTIIYTIKADIVYRGRTYNAVASFSKGELGAIQSDIAGINTGIANQTTTLGNQITGQTTTIQTSLTGTQSALTSSITGQTTTLQGSIAGQTTTLGNQIGSVGANVTALPTTVSSAVTTSVAAEVTAQLARGIQAELLTRPASVATGTTIPIRFRTATGLAPKITVYDPNSVARVSAAAMTEISTTGIYEYKLALNTAWGTGDFTVLVTESTRGSTDSLILHVGLGGLDEIYKSVMSGATVSSDKVSLDSIFAGVVTIQTNTNGLNNDITALLTRLGKTTDGVGANTLFGKISAIDTAGGKEDAILKGVDDIKSYVDSLEGSLGNSADSTASRTIFGRLADLEKLMNNFGSSSKEVQDAKARAMNLAALMQEIRADLGDGNMAEASAKLAALGQGLASLNEDLSGLPQAAGAASVGGAFDNIKNLAAGGGLEGLVPLLEEIKKGREAFNPENMTQMRNTVEELKSLMTEVRSLLDQEVNKPVVHGWLEEEQE